MGNTEKKPGLNSTVNMKNPSLNENEEDEEDINEPIISDCAGSSSSSTDEAHKYEEFAQKLKVTCPTCQGKGKLSQSQAESMVALIPVGDKRLRPRRTKLYLGIIIILALIAIFLIAFFLLPRTISIKIIDINTKKIFIPQEDDDSTPYIDVASTHLSRQVFTGKDVQKHVKTVCGTGWKWDLFEKFVTTASVSYMSRAEQLSNTFYGYTCCHNITSFL
ncbi:transmembrane protein 106B-like isoform X2 [Hydractinia symbiolongicarpus]|uniref:transmembrane protein 106B-like isoform X2 n=1 Tax=Hydractinia symbiolongicarpus TaxID=13093 RepID=UPI00254B52F7|nr:transmembrane protein 106B-like isoform X2 [Hydractinia symbiolongicarpus]